MDGMLEEFLQKQDIDILFLQAVTHHNFDKFAATRPITMWELRSGVQRW